MIKLTFPGKCISKDNEKLMGRSGRFVLGQRHRDFRTKIGLLARSQYCGRPVTGPLLVEITFWMPDRVHCDLLNLPKGICDALTGIVWEDDKQIEDAALHLRFDKTSPRTDIIVYQKEPL